MDSVVGGYYKWPLITDLRLGCLEEAPVIALYLSVKSLMATSSATAKLSLKYSQPVDNDGRTVKEVN